uniref:Uncharacterized protein n=1 Tax=Anopheles melas TaxID=34690 RepID=A0A182TSV8_9DIPT
MQSGPYTGGAAGGKRTQFQCRPANGGGGVRGCASDGAGRRKRPCAPNGCDHHHHQERIELIILETNEETTVAASDEVRTTALQQQVSADGGVGGGGDEATVAPSSNGIGE